MMNRAGAPACSARGIAVAAGGAFAAFYTFYAAAPMIFDGLSPSSGVRVAILMAVVVAVQPLVLVRGRWYRDRRPIVLATLVAMSLGIATLPLAGQWPGPLLLAAGFGVFVVTSTAWVKETAASGRLGKALGIYGFGSAAGGAIGAPTGLLLAHHTGVGGVALVGAIFAAVALIPTLRVQAASDPRTTNTIGPQSDMASPRTGRSSRKPKMSAVLMASATGHLLAVTIYAAALSALGASAESQSIWIIVGSAFMIQASLSAGRLIGGVFSDHLTPALTSTAALILLAISAAGFTLSTSSTVMFVAAVLIGLASGAAQTAALTAMMRRAHNSASTERASATWNICFDIGLGLGALSAGLLL